MTETSVFTQASRLLDGHFTADPSLRLANRDDLDSWRLTAYAAVKKVFGVERDDHPIAYNGSDWPRLAEQMDLAFSVLDDVASQLYGRDIQFIVWSTREGRTFDDVQAALAEADRRAPHLVVTETAALRPATKETGATHKHRWIICNLLGTVAQGRDTDVSDVVRDLLAANGRSDTEIIRQLDSIVDREKLPREAAELDVHVELWRAWGKPELAGLPFDVAVAKIGSTRFWRNCDDAALCEALQPFLQ